MNKQEAIERIESNALNIGDNDLVLGLNVAKHIINQINEPQKIAVPQFVADWYEENKDDIEYKLYKLCIDFREQKLRADLHAWFNDDNNKCIETLVKMKLYGYEVEKEKLYTVEIPNPNGDGYSKTFLGKFKDGKVELGKWSCYTSIEFADNWKQEEYAQLTESEIKKDFDWAWQFAEEVEE
jgi:hypothetical protein